MAFIIYGVGGIAAAVVIVSIIAMIADCVRVACDDNEHMGNWWDD